MPLVSLVLFAGNVAVLTVVACVYDDQFVYANGRLLHNSSRGRADSPDRYKMAGQWFGLPKLFPASENLGYEIVKNDDTLIQFKNKQASVCMHLEEHFELPNDEMCQLLGTEALCRRIGEDGRGICCLDRSGDEISGLMSVAVTSRRTG